jgi:O-antigen ligase/tetratricopeptide (TPR) repeat protein
MCGMFEYVRAILLSLCLVPLLVYDSFVSPFVTAKSIAITTIAGVVLIYIGLKRVRNVQTLRFSLISVCGLFLLGTLSVSSLLGQHWRLSIFGDIERGEGWLVLASCAAIFAIMSRWFTRQDWIWHIRGTLAVSAIVLVAVLWDVRGAFGEHSDRVDALFGNANYLAHYLLFVVFVSLGVAYKTTGVRRHASFLLAAFAILTLVYTGSRAALLSVAASAVVVATLLVRDTVFTTRTWLTITRALFVCVTVVGGFYITGWYQDIPALERLVATEYNIWEQPRTYIWSAGLDGFLESPLIGHGLESFGDVYDRHYDPASLKAPLFENVEPWSDRAHNMYLEMLVAGGILGGISYIGLILFALYYALRIPNPIERRALVGLLVAHSTFILFSFDSPTSWLLLAIVFAYIHTHTVSAPMYEFQIPQYASLPLSVLCVMCGVVLVNFSAVRVDEALAIRAIYDATPTALTDRWYKLNEFIPTSRTSIDYVLEEIPVVGAQAVMADRTLVSSSTFIASVEHAHTVVSAKHYIPPKTKYYYGLLLDKSGKTEAAIHELEELINAAPRKQFFRLELSRLYVDQKRFDDAVAMSRSAYELEPTYDNARLMYAVALVYSSDTATAHSLLEERYTTTTVAHEPLLEAYYRTGNHNDATTIARAVIAMNPGHFRAWTYLVASLMEAGLTNDAQRELAQAVKANPARESALKKCSEIIARTGTMCSTSGL